MKNWGLVKFYDVRLVTGQVLHLINEYTAILNMK